MLKRGINEMKKIGMLMNVCMGVTMSFFLSLVGNLTSGHFTVPGFLISFVVSTVISLIIGFIVPIKKISDGACGKAHLEPGSIKARLLDSVISDLIYTPFITLAMVTLAYFTIASHAPEGAPPFVPMFLSSLLISLAVGYVLIFVFTPLYLGILMKKFGPPMGQRPGAPGEKKDR